jgi:hypothetical protein
VSRNVYRLSLLLFTMACWPASPSHAASPPTAISFAEQPARLFRERAFYIAMRGVKLQDGDVIESGAAGIQVARGGAIIALGPASRVAFRLGARAPELVLLGGWLKIQAAEPALVSAGGLQLNAAGSSVIVHASAEKTELFVETGAPSVDEVQGGKALRHTTLAREQYAVRTVKEPLRSLPRPPKDFLAGMPPVFADMLVPVALKGAPPVPKLERQATFADVAPWFATEPALRQLIQRRYAPRKAAPAYSY